MAARALISAGRRVAGGRAGPPLLASCRNGASMNQYYSASAQPQREEEHDGGAGMTTGEQVEAAMNSQNVEVLEGEEHVATVLPDETIDIGGGAGEEASWVPDQETGVFGPADADTVTVATHGPPGATAMPAEGGSVLDQTLFVREDMEDVERPAIDMANASSKNY